MDEIVQEIRETRQRIFDECGNDLGRLIERLKAADSKDQDRLVSMDDVEQRQAQSEAAP